MIVVVGGLLIARNNSTSHNDDDGGGDDGNGRGVREDLLSRVGSTGLGQDFLKDWRRWQTMANEPYTNTTKVRRTTTSRTRTSSSSER